MKLQLTLIALLSCSSTACGDQCEALEAKVCEDLGAEDCAAWKQTMGTGSFETGRRSYRACFNARFNPTAYPPYLAGARAAAVVGKQVEEAKAKGEKAMQERAELQKAKQAAREEAKRAKQAAREEAQREKAKAL